MKSKNVHFVTLFPDCPNYGLTKDVGQIPYILEKSYENVTADLVTCRTDIEGANVNEVAGLKISPIPYLLNDFFSGAVYLICHSKQIDWLNIYHCGRKAYWWNKIYKYFNPSGKVYLKLDLDFVSCDLYDSDMRERRLFYKVTRTMDFVSVESTAVLERIAQYAGCNIMLISNGYCTAEPPPNIRMERSNAFITVGRLGTRQKATDTLLEAFAESAPYHNWCLKLVGTVEKEFESYIKEYFERNPQLKHRVIFMGPIENREFLYKEYCMAKVFVLPSRWEGFALVGPEAISCGCKVIVSDQVPSKNDVTANEKYGRIVPVDNVDVLAHAMIEATKDKYGIEISEEIAQYAKEKFSWKSICKKLYDEMLSI